MSPLFKSILDRIKYNRKKRELKAAFRRKPKPAKVDIPDEDVPVKPRKKQ
jgi:hypothetical protein